MKIYIEKIAAVLTGIVLLIFVIVFGGVILPDNGIAGFKYQSKQDIFVSVNDAWQRPYGYTRPYDEAAPLASMIIDCEPVYFEFDKKYWLIELWKGQYGMTTGCEIGIYYVEKEAVIPDVKPENLLYKAVPDSGRLKLGFALLKNGETLFEHRETHWWLTGFRPGLFSEPEELIMEAEITFLDDGMLGAFVSAIGSSGYTDGNLRVTENTVHITFSRPFSVQPRLKESMYKPVQALNREYCELYEKLTGHGGTTLEKLELLKGKDRRLYEIATSFGERFGGL